jgi:hypothetical protein
MIYTKEHWHTLKRSNRFQFLFEIAMLIAVAQSKGMAPRGEKAWDRISDDFESIYGKAKHLWCDVRAIRDPEHVSFLKNYKIDLYEAHQDLDQIQRLKETAVNWMKPRVRLGEHLELTPMPSTKNALIEFLYKHKQRQIRIHQQEYWNKSHLNSVNADTKYFVDPKDLAENDCIVMSLPLHGTYSVPSWTNELFEVCERKNIPILLDLCWVWFQHDIFLELKSPSIDTITCTLGKAFPIEGFRQGFKFVSKIHLSKYDTTYTTNRFGNQLLIDFMLRFPCDDIVRKYKQKQEYWCNRLGLKKTNSVHNAVAGDDLLWYAEHKHLVEDGVNQNFLNLIPLYENHDMVVDFINQTNTGRFGF